MFKHLKTILAAALCALVLSACSDAEQTFHQLAFEQPSNLVKELYADQRTDSVVFVSYDPWTATASEEWLVLSPTSGTTPAGVGVRNIVHLNFRTNDTGLSRTATINVASYFNGSCRVVQYPYINIIYPYARQQADGTYVFEHRLQASATTMQFVYNAFATQPSLTSDADWLTFNADDVKTGRNTLTLQVSPNLTEEERTARLTLTSNGISTAVTIFQPSSLPQ